jgi:hypothetical protein
MWLISIWNPYSTLALSLLLLFLYHGYWEIQILYAAERVGWGGGREHCCRLYNPTAARNTFRKTITTVEITSPGSWHSSANCTLFSIHQ